METKHRIISALLLAALVASAFGRAEFGAEFGADTGASVLWSPAFRLALLPALACGWFAAPWFGRAGVSGWAIALALVAIVTAVTGAALAVVGQGHLVAHLPRQPMAPAALGFAAVALQVLALRRQSRK